jgi:hypothetical protein
MKTITTTLLIILFSLITVSAPQAFGSKEDTDKTMDGHNTKKTGLIQGTLVFQDENKKKSPIPNHKVTMVIFQNNQQVLMLDKSTDNKGLFVYKNIFIDPDFKYAFGSIYKKNLYIFPKFSLEKSEIKKEIKFLIGKDSPYLKNEMLGKLPQNNSSMNKAVKEKKHNHKKPAHNPNWDKPFKQFALVLSGLVILLSLYLFFYPRKK